MPARQYLQGEYEITDTHEEERSRNGPNPFACAPLVFPIPQHFGNDNSGSYHAAEGSYLWQQNFIDLEGSTVTDVVPIVILAARCNIVVGKV